MHHPPVRFLLFSLMLILFCCCTVHSNEEHHNKRAPSGFFGMRGKKSISDAEYGIEEDNTITKESDNREQGNQFTPSDYLLMSKRAPYTSGFVGMRGKKPWDYTDELYKRSPQGFFGMRGKKSNAEENNYYDGILKRAPMGFFGMRGKKYIWQPYFQDDKRAPNGFFGMRGKKDYEDLFYEEEKRAPQSAFFGVRGKRMGFYGVRGKKIPYQFRGKFVGVRGKKSSQPNLITAENDQNNQDYLSESNLTTPNDLEWNQLMLLLTEQNSDNAENGLSKHLKSP